MNIEPKITALKKRYKVEYIEEELTVYVPFSLADEIASKTNESEEDITLLVSLIYRARIGAHTPSQYRKVSDEVICDSLEILLRKYNIYYLCDIFEDMKYCEFKEVFESKNILKNFEQKI